MSTPWAARDILDTTERLHNRARVLWAAAQVVHLRLPGRRDELFHESRDVMGVNVVSNLLSLVAIHLVQTTGWVLLD